MTTQLSLRWKTGRTQGITETLDNHPFVETGDICQNNHGGNVHSKAAHKKANKGANKAKQAILDALAGRYIPMTCEQLEAKTGLSHQTCSARISELKRARKIVKVGTGTTRAGCTAAAYLLA